MTIVEPPRGLASLVSPLTGVVTRLDERLLEPDDALLHSYWCESAADDASGGAGGMRAGGGWAATAERAKAAAVAEAAERYSAALPSLGALRLATAAEIGPAAIAPDRLRLFRDDQLAGTAFAHLRSDTRVRWARGIELPGVIPAWAPAQFVSLGGLGEVEGEPPLTIPTSNGLACGRTFWGAVLSALLEVVERDAFTATWAARLSLPLLTWEGDHGLEAFERQRLVPSALRYAAVDLSAFLAIPVVLAVITTPGAIPGPTAVGAAASTSAADAVERALGEAGAAFAAARALRRVHRDRVLAADGSDIETFDDRVLFYSDPAHSPRLAFLTASSERRHVDDLPRIGGDGPREVIEALCARLAARGARAYAFDVTAPDIAAAGLHVVRVVCPELCPLDPSHSQRFLGVPRLLTAASAVGLRARPLRPEEVNSDPHPFP